MDWSDWKEWMTLPLKRYFEFTGRSRRKEFWLWVLGVVAVSIVLNIIDSILGFGAYSNYATGGFGGRGLLSNLFAVAVFIPNLAVGVRRLHDTDRSGLWVLLMLPFYGLSLLLFLTAILGLWGLTLFFVGLAVIVLPLGALCAIGLLVLCCLEGTRGPNRYGPDPKGPEGVVVGGEALH